MQALSAGTDAGGQPDVFVLTAADAFAQFAPSTGWQVLGNPGSVRTMSATALGRVFVVTADQSVFEHDPTFGWLRLTAAGFAHG